MLAAAGLSAQPLPPFVYTFSLPAGARIEAVTVDPAGHAYFAGTTGVALPVTHGAFQTEYRACPPLTVPRGPTRPPCPWAFAGKLSPDGKLAYLTYLAGSNGISNATAIAADAAGNAYVAGTYYAVDDQPADFPVTPGAFQTSPNGPNAFVAKLDASGSSLAWATYFGGNRHVRPRALAPDADGAPWVAFGAGSPDLPLRQPLPGMAASVEFGYLTKFKADGSDLLFATYVNGPGARSGINALTTDRAGAIYLAGGCFYEQPQTEPCVPVTAGAFQSRMNGPSAMYVMKIQADGTLAFSTLLGGRAFQGSRGIALDAEDNILLAGSVTPASSEPTRFPVTPGAFQENIDKRSRWAGSGFVAKLNRSGTSLLFSTYFGGASYDGITGFALKADGDVAFSGYSYSPDLPLTPDAWQPCHPPAAFQIANGPSASFLGRLGSDGTTLLHASFIGPSAYSDPPPEAPLSDLRLAGVDRGGDLYLSGLQSAVPVLMRYRLVTRPPGAAACLASATHGFESPIAPGMLASVRGNRVAGDRSAAPGLDSSGSLPTSWNGLQVLIDGLPAPLLRIVPDEITVVVPFAVRTGTGVTVQVVQDGTVTSGFTAPSQTTAPAIVTAHPSGFGDAAALNEDGSINSPKNPAVPGSVVTLYLTGLGAIDPPFKEGTISTGAGVIRTGLEVNLYPSWAEILYAGPAPGLLAGVYQVNIRVPETPLEDWVPLSVTAGDRAAQPQVGLYVSCASANCVRLP
jgi:uncharacterized protein (TIGR03437 family)